MEKQDNVLFGVVEAILSDDILEEEINELWELYQQYRLLGYNGVEK